MLNISIKKHKFASYFYMKKYKQMNLHEMNGYCVAPKLDHSTTIKICEVKDKRKENYV